MVLSDFFHHCQIQILEALGLFCVIFLFHNVPNVWLDTGQPSAPTLTT